MRWLVPGEIKTEESWKILAAPSVRQNMEKSATLERKKYCSIIVTIRTDFEFGHFPFDQKSAPP